ncbi:MAG: hypothetical protein Q4B60_01385 [Erysipelotrichaceae bacterium]|nr:hypothetical protein [Erysipelotrichaceae bacterium]
MKDKRIIRKIAFVILGTIVLGLSIGMVVKVGIGSDSLSATYEGINKRTGVSLGTITALSNAFMFIFSFVFNRKIVGIGTIIFILCSKIPVDIGNAIMITTESLPINIVLYTLSNVVMALGSALFILSDLGASGYDAFTLTIDHLIKHKIPYVYLRYITDGTLLIVAFLLGGTIGIGTIITWALIAILLKMWLRILEPVVKKIDEKLCK